MKKTKKGQKLFIDINIDDVIEQTGLSDEATKIPESLEPSDFDPEELDELWEEKSKRQSREMKESAFDEDAFYGTMPIDKGIASSIRLHELYQNLLNSWGWVVCGSILWSGNPATGIWAPMRSEREFDVLVRTLVKDSVYKHLVNNNSSKELHTWLLSIERLRVRAGFFPARR